MTGDRLVILDPAFVSGEGHHLGVNGMLAAAAMRAGCEPIVVANAASRLNSISYEGVQAPVAALLRHSPYTGPALRSLEELISLNENAYRQFRDLPSALFDRPVRILVHTTNENQVLGLARWLSESVGTQESRIESAVVALMLPPPIAYQDSKVIEEDPAACEIYRRALRLMASIDNVSVLGIGRTVAEDHSYVSGTDVGVGGALTGGIGRVAATKRNSEQPTILLYTGDAKLDKGLHLLPAIIRLLRDTSIAAQFIVQISGALVERYSWIVTQIKSVAKGDSRFIVLEGRLEEAAYNDLWDQADGVVLCYHPGAYGRRTSGICWDSMNSGLPAVVIANTWHTLEFEHYDFPAIESPAFQPAPIAQAIVDMVERLPHLQDRAAEARPRFRDENDPMHYIAKLFVNANTQEIGARWVKGKGLCEPESFGDGLDARWLSAHAEIELHPPEWMRSIEIEGVFDRGHIQNDEVTFSLAGQRLELARKTVRAGVWVVRFNVPDSIALRPKYSSSLQISAPKSPLPGTDIETSIMVSKIRYYRKPAEGIRASNEPRTS